jgi:two-component system nitrogen regulation sensor histidine kinase NtrY
MRLRYEQRVFLMALAAGLPGVAGVLLLIWGAPSWINDNPRTVTIIIVAAWIFLAAALRRHIIFPLQTVSNLVAALREGDFSVRGRSSRTTPWKS